MFKVKNWKTNEIVQVLSTYFDDFGQTWFLIWINNKWCWRPADNYVPPNYIKKNKVIIAGSRSFNNFPLAERELSKYLEKIGEVVCGEAQGADTIGRNWATKHSIPIKSFPADWKNDGQAAGFIRNKKMGDYADELIAFWDEKSVGTEDMILYMQKIKKPVTIIRI